MATKQEAQWTTRDGQTVAISGMADSHLVNTIRYLRRHCEPYRLRYVLSMGAYAADAPDGAADATEMAIDELTDAGADEALEMMVPQYETMLAEAESRGLTL